MTAAPSLDGALALLRSEPPRTAILLDVDGTLAPIVRHADDAHVSEGTRKPLIAIARAYGFVACVSGRQAHIARRIVSLGSITYIGNHGVEVLRGGTTEVEIDPEVAEWTERVRAFAARALTDPALNRLRVRGEDKVTIAAFHWRGAPDEDAAEAAVRTVAERAEQEGLAVHWGRKVLEIRPPVTVDKGRGIERVLAGVDLHAAMYVGDDRTDVDAFDALRRMVASGMLRDAVCVGVSSEETPAELLKAADIMVDGTRGVRELLEAPGARGADRLMRFVDLLKTTVLLSAGAATALAAICVGRASAEHQPGIVFIFIGWWLVAAIVGARIGRAERATPPIARLLADAKAATSLPESAPTTIVLNRLWPLIVSLLAAGGLAFLAPQIPGVASGFAIIWALAWRRQDAAVAAIEERDGVTFFVEKTSLIGPMQLVRTPGFRRDRPPA